MTEAGPVSHESSDPEPTDDNVRVEETTEAQGVEDVYFSLTFNNIPRSTAEQILQEAHKLAGDTSFSAFYDTAQSELNE